jgi:pyruvate,water dikinase
MYIYPLNRLPSDKYCLAGGKARSLAYMIKNTNLHIPEGYVITSDAFEEFRLRKEAVDELSELLEKLSDRSTYAVRSSALNEDGDNASFAGQYETVTDVKKSDIVSAIETVAASSDNSNVKAYTNNKSSGHTNKDTIAIIIQRYVMAEYAGVLFTSDVITGKDEKMVGNYVCGEGERLVSGIENAKEFKINAVKFAYEGPAEFSGYAKTLSKYCTVIRKLYGIPMDIEWAVSDKKVYILQARPITTLRRLNMENYDINGTRSAYKMLTRTNVGEIFMKPVSPMTFSVLEKINEILGLPEWLDNINGQPYMNISVMCSLAVSFGFTREKAYESIKGLVGRVPDDVEVPVSPFDKKAFLRRIFRLFFPEQKSRLTKQQKKEMVNGLADIARNMIKDIRKIGDVKELSVYWEEVMLTKLRDGMSSVIGQSGTSMVPLFNTRNSIAKIAGDDMAERLCTGCLGLIESMKPLFLIYDVIEGKISKDEYIKTCGQRCPNEMELAAVHPYEDDSYVDRLITEHKDDHLNMYEMQKSQKKTYEDALAEFKVKYPGKRRWIDRKISRFVKANEFREELRSKGVWIFCVFREYILQVGRLTGLDDDVFMLTFDELFSYLKGERISSEKLAKRREAYERYMTSDPLPNVVVGRFDVDEWMADTNHRSDFYIQDMKQILDEDADIKGFAGAAGVVRGKVRVVNSIENIGDIKGGDILVTVATNVGWTPVFTKVSAIVTDIGAPLSHAAIVARECGIPAVVGCGNATTLLHTGDEVIVDGGAGTVKKVL